MDPLTGQQDFNASDAQQASQLARAGRGARVGTKAGRIIRIIRLIRLIRIVKLYKHAHQAFDDEDAVEHHIEKKMRKEQRKSLKSQSQKLVDKEHLKEVATRDGKDPAHYRTVVNSKQENRTEDNNHKDEEVDISHTP